MDHPRINPAAFQVYPLTPKLWRDFEKLFGTHGAYGGRWCMWWPSTRREFEARKGEGNRRALKATVHGPARHVRPRRVRGMRPAFAQQGHHAL